MTDTRPNGQERGRNHQRNQHEEMREKCEHSLQYQLLTQAKKWTMQQMDPENKETM
jgi:hypothetical protein